MTNKHSIDNHLFEGACFRGVWYSSSTHGPTGHDYANSSTCINMEQRLPQRRYYISDSLRCIAPTCGYSFSTTPLERLHTAMSSSAIKATPTYNFSYSSTCDIYISDKCGHYDNRFTLWRAASSGDIKSVYPIEQYSNLRDIFTRTRTYLSVSTIEPTPLFYEQTSGGIRNREFHH